MISGSPEGSARPARVLKITLAYDGTRFVGWQRQAEGPSIQGMLEDALARIEGREVTVHGAGRTDAGVHALGQVASAAVTCAHDGATLLRALNAQLPRDIRVMEVVDEAPHFHARFSARSKRYRYQVRNAPIVSPFERGYVWHVPEPLDLGAIEQAAAAVVGAHDFAAFRRAGSETRGTIRTMTHSRATRDASGLLTYEIEGDGFLRHMVRALVGTLVEVGRGWRDAGSMASLLAGGTRSQAGATAPAHGLFLVRVDYN